MLLLLIMYNCGDIINSITLCYLQYVLASCRRCHIKPAYWPLVQRKCVAGPVPRKTSWAVQDYVTVSIGAGAAVRVTDLQLNHQMNFAPTAGQKKLSSDGCLHSLLIFSQHRQETIKIPTVCSKAHGWIRPQRKGVKYAKQPFSKGLLIDIYDLLQHIEDSFLNSFVTLKIFF